MGSNRTVGLQWCEWKGVWRGMKMEERMLNDPFTYLDTVLSTHPFGLMKPSNENVRHIHHGLEVLLHARIVPHEFTGFIRFERYPHPYWLPLSFTLDVYPISSKRSYLFFSVERLEQPFTLALLGLSRAQRPNKTYAFLAPLSHHTSHIEDEVCISSRHGEACYAFIFIPSRGDVYPQDYFTTM